jgi:D-threo-aldose 1-dehydrogenase
VLTGARSVAEVEENCAAFRQPIPAAFWTALREQGLLHGAAPVPDATAKGR